MADLGTEATEGVRTVELIGSLCLATDLGMGFPFEHGLQTTLIAMRLAERLGVDPGTATEVYYASMLAHAGCTTDVHLAAEIFGGSMTEHFNPVKYGTPRESFLGLVRSLPDPDAHRLERTAQIADGWFPQFADVYHVWGARLPWATEFMIRRRRWRR